MAVIKEATNIVTDLSKFNEYKEQVDNTINSIERRKELYSKLKFISLNFINDKYNAFSRERDKKLEELEVSYEWQRIKLEERLNKSFIIRLDKLISNSFICKNWFNYLVSFIFTLGIVYVIQKDAEQEVESFNARIKILNRDKKRQRTKILEEYTNNMNETNNDFIKEKEKIYLEIEENDKLNSIENLEIFLNKSDKTIYKNAYSEFMNLQKKVFEEEILMIDIIKDNESNKNRSISLKKEIDNFSNKKITLGKVNKELRKNISQLDTVYEDGNSDEIRNLIIDFKDQPVEYIEGFVNENKLVDRDTYQNKIKELIIESNKLEEEINKEDIQIKEFENNMNKRDKMWTILKSLLQKSSDQAIQYSISRLVQISRWYPSMEKKDVLSKKSKYSIVKGFFNKKRLNKKSVMLKG